MGEYEITERQTYHFHFIVKRVSWFKSSLLPRIQTKYTNKLQFLIKTKSSIFNWKDSKIARENQAWLGLG
jgi:hypothetical protein